MKNWGDNMKNYLLILGIISVFLISACAQQPEPAQPTPQPAIIEPAEEVESDTPSQEPIQAETPAPGFEDTVVETVVVSDTDPQLVEIDVVARQWDFNPATITVSEGDKVKLNIKSVDVTHGFALFEFGVNERLTPGKTTTVEFTADKAGEYTFFCSVPCGRGHSGMNGKLVVE